MSENVTNAMFKPTKVTSKSALIKMETDRWEIRSTRWARAQPLVYHGVNVTTSNKTEFGPSDVEMDDQGNITNMPLLIGRPCFGIPTAYLRHGRKKPQWVQKSQSYKPTRCMKCKVQAACEKVCRARIKLIPEMGETIKDWQKKGGRVALKTPVKHPKCDVSFEKITRLTKQHPFSSSNDDKVKAFYAKQRIDFLEKDKLRKRKARAKAIKEGAIDDGVMDFLKRSRVFRLILLKQACKEKPLSPRLRHLDEQGIVNTADVWLEKAILLAEKKKVNPSKIAKNLIEKDKSKGVSYDVLRGRVTTDLRRIEFLESSRSSHSRNAVWPKFNVDKELADYIKYELP
jgi:hypothetical protein